MPRLRGLQLQQFVTSLQPDRLSEYFSRIHPQNPPQGWQLLNGDALEQYLDAPAQTGIVGLVDHDFPRIQALGTTGVGILFRAYEKSPLSWDDKLTPETQAMHLFLDAPEAFDFAWSRYLLMSNSGQISVHPFSNLCPR